MCDATDKYLALSGELLKEVARRAKSMPRVKISVADEHYDESRAMGYCEAMTGERPTGVIWAHCNGEKRPRVRACTFGEIVTYGRFGVELKSAPTHSWDIPNWNWTGHNQTVDDCRQEVEIDISA